MKVLVIVDPQWDFVERGALPVEGGEHALRKVFKLLRKDKSFNGIVITQDWHPKNHCSFKEQGGEWAEHCVGGTRGAQIYTTLANYLEANAQAYSFIYLIFKGTEVDKDEYSAFANPTHIASTGEVMYDGLNLDPEDEIVICGLAGDVCVLNSLKDLMKEFKNISVYVNGTASIDGGEKLTKFMKENKIKTYELS